MSGVRPDRSSAADRTTCARRSGWRRSDLRGVARLSSSRRCPGLGSARGDIRCAGGRRHGRSLRCNRRGGDMRGDDGRSRRRRRGRGQGLYCRTLTMLSGRRRHRDRRSGRRCGRRRRRRGGARCVGRMRPSRFAMFDGVASRRSRLVRRSRGLARARRLSGSLLSGTRRLPRTLRMLSGSAATVWLLLCGRSGLGDPDGRRRSFAEHIVGPDDHRLATQQHRNEGAHGQDFPKFPHIDLS